MAKKSSNVRVHQLAKELGVASKEIVAKCEDEGIPGVTNHMSSVSLGLQATIKEWFGDSESAVATAIEPTATVDIQEVRERARQRVTKKAARKKAAKKKEPETTAEVAAEAKTTQKPEAKAPEATEEAVAPETEKEAATAAESEQISAAEAETSVEPEGKAADEVDAAATVTDADAETVEAESKEGQSPQSKQRDVRENVPDRPEEVTPAGPRLEKPQKSELAGPRVVRVEAPEIVQPPRRSGPRPTRPGGPPRVGPEPAGAPADRGRTSRRNKRRTAYSRDDGGRSGRSGGGETDRGTNWRQQDLLEREQRLNRAGGFFKSHRRDKMKKSTGGQRATPVAKTGGQVRIEEPIVLKNLSAATGVRVNDIVRQLVRAGKPLVKPDAVIDAETARELMVEWDVDLEIVAQKTASDQIVEEFSDREMVNEKGRSPVVTILGHVDHGKTTLLDSIRNTSVAEGEAGGITQATSAFQVPVALENETHLVTFIDTPGHEAFTEMRARGAKVTDIVVLVVAADDGIMPQTVESINHAKAAGVPIIVALNKIDKPEATDANIQRIFGELAEHDLNPVEWGGNTEVVRISALKREGINELLELIDFQAQLLELTADFGGAAQGTVIEAQMEEGRGPVATFLVQQGKLKKGDTIVCGTAYGRVRDLVSDKGKKLKEATPSVPIAVSGLNAVPKAGDKFYAVKNIRDAEASASEKLQQTRQRELATEKVTLDNIFDKLAESGRMELPMIVKADVHGSVETLTASLNKIANEEVRVVVKHAAVGAINESDVSLAEATGAIVVGFNVSATPQARRTAEQKGIDIRYYDVIYDLTDDVKKAAEGLLEPEVKIDVLGHAEVREVFKVSKVGMVAGCYVTDGVIERNSLVRVTRDGIVVEKDRRLEQLKRFKDDVKDVRSGQECGMKIDGYDDIKTGDVIECYKTREVRRTL